MRLRAMIAGCAGAAALMAAAAGGASPAQAADTVCTWGGTPASPTGWFEFTGQGLTNTPAPQALPFRATGPLAGGCSGTLTYKGQENALSTCTFGTFEAAVTGLPGVARAAGIAPGGMVPSLLYDRHGNAVGTETAQLLSDVTQESDPAFTNCGTPQGFAGGAFSSVVTLTG